MHKRISAIGFLIVFLFSISVFSAEVHFCKGEMTDISFFGDASCSCPKMAMTKCKMHLKKKSCCDTVTLEHENTTDFDHFSTELLSIDLLIILPIIIDEVILEENYSEIPVDSYVPPDLKCDLTILFQSFLI